MHPATVWRFKHVTSLPALARMVLELSAEGIEGVTHRDVRIFMCMVCTRIAADHDLAAGDSYIDADRKQLALLVMVVVACDHHPARGDALAELLQFCGALTNTRFERRRWIHWRNVICSDMRALRGDGKLSCSQSGRERVGFGKPGMSLTGGRAFRGRRPCW